MTRKMRNYLKQAYAAPTPLHKEGFIQNYERPIMSTFQFILSQIGYIRKWIWALSSAIFFVSLIGAAFLNPDMLWVIYAITPMLALTIITESGRSEIYEMSELEMATRFSRKSVIMARLTILGIENLLLLGMMFTCAVFASLPNPLQAGLFMITPYLLTTFLGLYIVRKFNGREANYFCVGITIGISLFNVFLHINLPQLFQGGYLVWWLVGILLLAGGNINQCYKIVNGKEEFA